MTQQEIAKANTDPPQKCTCPPGEAPTPCQKRHALHDCLLERYMLDLLRLTAGTHVIVPLERNGNMDEAGAKAAKSWEKSLRDGTIPRRSLWDTIYRAMIAAAQEETP